MKDNETKSSFIELRAVGKSYDAIAKELHISKSTCKEWGDAFEAEIKERKRAELDALYNEYGMAKASRIERLGKTLKQIDKALDVADLSSVPPEKLLDMKLKYAEALANEYAGESPLIEFKGDSAGEVLRYLGDLLARVRSGEASKDQAGREVAVLGSFLKAYDQLELKKRIDAIEGVMEARL